MAEQFLEEIYSNAMIIDNLRECVSYLSRYDNRRALKVYNDAMAALQDMLSEYGKTNPMEAKDIQDDAINMIENWNDQSYITGMINGSLIPKLFKYMSNFTDIEVEDKGHLLKSSDSGFLTIKSAYSGRFLHDIHDPMEEADTIANVIYDASREEAVFFGCGLGYLPYKVWKKSGGAVSIVIYEEDAEVLEYARHYGVLDWIDESSLKIVHDEDGLTLLGKFLEKLDFDSKTTCTYITPEKKYKYRGSFDGQFDYICAILQYGWELDDIIKINLWKNGKLKARDYKGLKKDISADEWVVVAAGPSFDDNIDFLKESKGKRKIVAVNTVLKRLEKENIIPDLLVAADSFDQLQDHIEGVEEFTKPIPLIADWVTSWRFTYRYKGDICFVSTPTGGTIEEAFHKRDDVWDVSGTIASMAIEAAVRMEAKKLYLVGLDLAFPSGKDYAGGMPHGKLAKAGQTMLVKSVDGGMVETAPTFNSFREIIEQKLSQNKDKEFYNMSKHGAYIAGAKAYS